MWAVSPLEADVTCDCDPAVIDGGHIVHCSRCRGKGIMLFFYNGGLVISVYTDGLFSLEQRDRGSLASTLNAD